jgi:hypothetical protein
VTSTESAQGSGWWRVDARGRVRNDATYAIWLRRIDVKIEQETRSLIPQQETLQPGDEIDWRFYGDVYAPSGQPTAGSVTVALDWRWSQGNYDWCPTT